MKFIKYYEDIFDKTITDGVFTIGDIVHIENWEDAKILKVYDYSCLVELEDGFTTNIFKSELKLFTPEEIQAKKYNL